MRQRARALLSIGATVATIVLAPVEASAGDGAAPAPSGTPPKKPAPPASTEAAPPKDAPNKAPRASRFPEEEEPKGAKDAPRPPPFRDDLPLATLPPMHRLDVGADALLVNRLASDYIDGAPSHIAYRPTIGFGIHARVQIIRYLQVGAYFYGAEHGFAFGQGALGIRGNIDSEALTTVAFGAKAMPTLPLGERVRLWGTLGVGWGRFEFPQMTAREPGRDPFVIKGRGNSFVEFPMGLGASFEIIKNWLAVDIEITGAPLVHKKGTSFVPVQALDNGHERNIAPMPESHLSIVQALGLSLLL